MTSPNRDVLRQQSPFGNCAELVRAAQAGDEAALEALLAGHYGWLSRLLVAMCSDDETASDVAQESMLLAARRIESLQDARAFRPWLYRIAANCLNAHRRRHRRRPAVSLDELLARFPLRRELAALDARVELCAERELVHDALASLSRSDRDLLLLSYVAGFTSVEIARAIGVTPVTARKRINRAAERYQRAYATLAPAPTMRLERTRVV